MHSRADARGFYSWRTINDRKVVYLMLAESLKGCVKEELLASARLTARLR